MGLFNKGENKPSFEEIEQLFLAAKDDLIEAENNYVEAYKNYVKCKQNSDAAFFAYARTPSEKDHANYLYQQAQAKYALQAEDVARAEYNQARKKYKKLSRIYKNCERKQQKSSSNTEERQPE